MAFEQLVERQWQRYENSQKLTKKAEACLPHPVNGRVEVPYRDQQIDDDTATQVCNTFATSHHLHGVIAEGCMVFW